MKGDLGYFTMPVRDIDAGMRFYEALFGWRFNRENDDYAHADNSAPAGGIVRSDATVLEAWFRIDGDIQKAAALVRGLGGTAEEPKESASGWSCACIDDQGTKFNLWQPAQGL